MRWLAVFLICCFSSAYAAEDFYSFTSVNDQERFHAITSELRCLVCQNQNLAESNAPLAADLRQQIYQKIRAGQSDRDIVDFLVARYSQYILYRPPFSSQTLFLWFGPFFILLFGLSYILFYIKKSQGK